MSSIFDGRELSDELFEFLLTRYGANTRDPDYDIRNGGDTEEDPSVKQDDEKESDWKCVCFYEFADPCYIPIDEYEIWKRVLKSGPQSTAPARFLSALERIKEEEDGIEEIADNRRTTAGHSLDRWLDFKWLWEEPEPETPPASHLFLSRLERAD